MGVVRPDAISKDPILRGGSMKMLAVFLFFVSTVFAQSVQVIPWKPAPARATSNGPLKSSGGQQTRHAYFQSDDSVFPHLATGGGWETVIVIVNMSAATMQYSTYFYNQNGGPMSVTFRESPSGNIVNATAIASTLPPGASFNFSLFDTSATTQVGWAFVDYDSSVGRLGGYAVFRQRIQGRPDFEALVPLSSYFDHRFYLPVDELEGFVTAMAICNPASNSSTNVVLRMTGLDGIEISRRSLTLAPGNQTTFLIRDRFPEMINRLGTLYVEGSSDELSAIGLRFNTLGGSAFSSVPIMNWSGMFP